MATTKEIEDAGYQAVIDHESRAGRTAVRKTGVHYDMLSTGNGEVRHIEVKASKHRYPAWHVLQPKVFKSMRTDDQFFMYVVCDALGASPVVYEITRDELLQRFSGIEFSYKFTMGKLFFTAKDRIAQQSPAPYSSPAAGSESGEA